MQAQAENFHLSSFPIRISLAPSKYIYHKCLFQISKSNFVVKILFLKQLFLEYFSKLIIKTFLISLNISTQINPELHNRSIFISWNNPLGSYCGECLRSCYLNKYFYFFDVFHTSTIDLLVRALVKYTSFKISIGEIRKFGSSNRSGKDKEHQKQNKT